MTLDNGQELAQGQNISKPVQERKSTLPLVESIPPRLRTPIYAAIMAMSLYGLGGGSIPQSIGVGGSIEVPNPAGGSIDVGITAASDTSALSNGLPHPINEHFVDPDNKVSYFDIKVGQTEMVGYKIVSPKDKTATFSIRPAAGIEWNWE